MLIVFILLLILLIAGLTEKFTMDRLISKVPIRILVNGTRGKTSTVRLVSAAMNEAGIKTMAKTTGSEACFVFPDGSIEPVNRKHGRNMVREQRSLFRLAVNSGCKAVVCECMAVRPESQIVFSRKLFKPTAVAITNSYKDHVDQMGEYTQEVLNLSVPEGLEAITCNAGYEGSLDDFRTKFNRKSIALALKVCTTLNIDEQTALKGMKKAVGDVGITDPLRVGKRLVVNGFAANDVHSAGELLASYNPDKITVVFANRADREFRMVLFRELFEKAGISDLAVIGDNLFKCRRYLNCRSYRKNEFGSLIDSSRETIVCLGNIVGCGQAFLDYCTGENK